MKKKHILILIVVFMLVLYASASVVAKTVYCSNCSDHFTQALDRVTNVEQLRQLAKEYEQSIQQTAQQIALVQNNLEQYANMVQNTISLPQSILNDAKQDLNRLAQLTSSLNTQRGDIAAMSEIFGEIYPNLSAISDLFADPYAKLTDLWDEWTKATDTAAEALFQLTGSQLNELANDSNVMNSHIDSLLTTPEGQMQAMQAGNNLAALQIQEMRQLRELVATMAQTSLQMALKEEKKEQMSQEIWREMHKTDLLKKQYEGYE